MAKKKVSARKRIVKKVSRRTSIPSMFKSWRPGPLSSSFMVTSLIGLLISVYIIFPRSTDFGIASILVFIVMLISSLISMHKAPPKLLE